jgi:hypothetical protein
LPGYHKGLHPTDKGLNQIDNLGDAFQCCQGGGAATQMPAEHYHSGSNPDLGLIFKGALLDAGHAALSGRNPPGGSHQIIK